MFWFVHSIILRKISSYSKIIIKIAAISLKNDNLTRNWIGLKMQDKTEN